MPRRKTGSTIKLYHCTIELLSYIPGTYVTVEDLIISDID